MIFSNLNYISFLIFLLILIFFIIELILIYKKNKNISILFLFFSILFLLVNIFQIKWWYNSYIKSINWSKLIFVLDVSKSMNVEDINYKNKKISRLNLSKKIIDSYIWNNINNEYWLIIFSQDAFELIPLTSDIHTYKTVLNTVSSNSILNSWTNINSVFESLNNYFISNMDWWSVVILTDWWDENINVNKNLIDNFKNKNINISVIWIWTKQWWYIPNLSNQSWKIEYKTYNWNLVLSKLNEDNLKNFCDINDFYYNYISNYDENDKIYDFINKNINLINIQKNIDYRTDYTRFFILFSFVFFVLFLLFDNFIWKRKK